MPLITVTYSSVRKAPSLKAEIASAVSDLTARILRKDPKVTAIIVKAVDAADWFAGGQSLAEQSLASFWLDVHVSEGTNTKDEKAAYLAALFQRMGELLGPLHEESYAHVDEVKGDAYGFGGLTQERRYIAGQLEVAPRKADQRTRQLLLRPAGFSAEPGEACRDAADGSGADRSIGPTTGRTPVVDRQRESLWSEPASTKTACPGDWTPYDFPTVTAAGRGTRGCARRPANVGS